MVTEGGFHEVFDSRWQEQSNGWNESQRISRWSVLNTLQFVA